jgi:hypothetical protein
MEALALLLPYLPLVLKIAPDVQAAIRIGGPALEAIGALAPELIPIFRSIGSTLASQRGGTMERHAEAVGRRIFQSISARHDTWWLQRALNALGSKIGVDGVYGEETVRTVTQYQTARGCRQIDGLAGDGETVPMIEAELEARGLAIADGPESVSGGGDRHV